MRQDKKGQIHKRCPPPIVAWTAKPPPNLQRHYELRNGIEFRELNCGCTDCSDPALAKLRGVRKLGLIQLPFRQFT